MSKPNPIHIAKLPNGITLIAEEMDFVSSAAISILIPSGAATDPIDREGSASVLSEMLNKGAGPYNSREFSEELERYGIHHGNSAGIEVSMVSAALLGENLPHAIRMLAELILRPRLPEEELDSVRQLALQELLALEDEPSSKVMVELAKVFYPYPFGRSQLGTEQGLKSLTVGSLREYFKEYYVPSGVIIGVAGKFSWPELKGEIEKHFSEWSGAHDLLPPKKLASESRIHHIEKDTSQMQIALAYPSVSLEHPDYATARVSVGILSGGMAGRLFVEVREKRGLVYRVSASHSAAKGRAAILCYAGTTPERSQETLDVMVTELRKLGEGVTEEELARAKADLKSKIIMQGESSSARASSVVNDWWNLGRVRTLEEIKNAIQRVTNEDIRRHLGNFPVSPVTLVTLGPKPLELPR